MAYMLLIVEPRGQREARSDLEGREVYARMLEFGGELDRRGQLITSHSLLSDTHGVRLQKREGRSSTKDGPFAEAKEMVGGFYLIDCAGMDEALAIAAECPAAEWATVEVRETGPCFAG